jgi:hypothetical protein
MNRELSRREFIKLTGSAALGLTIPQYPPGGNPYLTTPLLKLGRAVRSLHYYEKPEYSSAELGFYNTDAVFKILEEKMGDTKYEENPIWVRSEDGWLNSTYIQPVRSEKNKPVMDIPANGMLAEVTVPYTQSWSMDGVRRKRAYRYYYSSTHWVYNAYPTSDGTVLLMIVIWAVFWFWLKI